MESIAGSTAVPERERGAEGRREGGGGGGGGGGVGGGGGGGGVIERNDRDVFTAGAPRHTLGGRIAERNTGRARPSFGTGSRVLTTLVASPQRGYGSSCPPERSKRSV